MNPVMNFRTDSTVPAGARVRLARDGSVYVAGDGADAIGHATTSGTGGQAIVELWGEGVVLITAAAPFPAGTGLRTVADGRGAGGQAWCVALQPAAEAGDRIQALRIGTARIQTTPDDPPDEQKAGGGKPRAVRSGASPADLRAFASSYARKHDAPARTAASPPGADMSQTAPDPIADWQYLLDGLRQANPCASAYEATIAAARKFPRAHQAYLLAVNGSRGDIVASRPSAGAKADTAAAEFRAQVERLVSAGMSRADAMTRVIRTQPALHAAFIQEANPSRAA